MSRNKYPEETVNLILDVSYKLFLEKGYEKTTVQDIVDNMGGLTKGALYHHFKSKEDVLIGVSNRMFAESAESQKYAELISSDLPAKEKLRKYIELIIGDRAENALRKIYPDLKKTPQFLVKMLENTMTGGAAKILADIFRQAAREGSIKTGYPEQLAEAAALLMNLWVNPYIWKMNGDELMRKIYFVDELFSKYGAGSFRDMFSPNLLTSIFQMKENK
jgi:Transcriptional regulator